MDAEPWPAVPRPANCPGTSQSTGKWVDKNETERGNGNINPDHYKK